MRNTFTWASGVALVAVGVLTSQPVRAQAPAWQSAIALGQTETGYSEVDNTVVDASGNVYIVGAFSGTIQVGATTLTAPGREGIFVAKWSSASRSFAWAQRAGGAGLDYANSIAVSGTSVYIAGAFRSQSADFGGFSLLNANQDPNQFSGDLFIAKLTDAGTSASFTWAQRAGGTASEEMSDLVVVGNTLYATGTFASASFQLGNTTLANKGSYDAFVAKLTDAGTSATINWAQGGGGTGSDSFDKLAVNGTNIVVAGDFEGTASFGTPAATITSAGKNDVMVAKLTDSGTSAQYAWVQRAGGAEGEHLGGLAVSGNNIYIAGDFSGATSSFGATTLQNTGGTTGNDAFVAKLTDAGTTASFTWAQKAGGTDYDEANALLVRGTSIYIAGNFSSATASFGGLSLANTSATRTYDIFVARLQDAGSTSSFVWVQQGGSDGNDYCRSLASGGTTVYVGGSTRLPATFGSQSLPGTSASVVGFWATVTDATGLAANNPSALAELTLAPNPAHGATTVLLPASAGNAKITLTLLDAVGRVVRTQAAQTGRTPGFDLAGVAPGLYMLRVQAGETLAVHQLVVD
jgi:hypothetical protein